jgi:hypothetical protein
MADSVSTVTLSSGKVLSVDGSLSGVAKALQSLEPGVPPLWALTDTDGTGWLVNVNEIVAVEGTF